jgi:biopolymer transport protein TolQ
VWLFARGRKARKIFDKINWAKFEPDDFKLRFDRFAYSPIARVYNQVFKEYFAVSSRHGDEDALTKLLQKQGNAQLARLEARLGILASVGAASPFIGLFGTVWGVMRSFLNIGTWGSTSLAVVAPGIAEALIATAAGLAAAIPAVVAYNYFLGNLKDESRALEEFSTDLILAERSRIAAKGSDQQHPETVTRGMIR